METPSNSSVPLSEHIKPFETFKDRVGDVMNDEEFELRQQLQAELIRLSKCDARSWIECYSERFARLWENGIIEIEDMLDNLYDERDPLMMELILKSGLGAKRWKKIYEDKFNTLWNQRAYESMGKEGFIFILYDK